MISIIQLGTVDYATGLALQQQLVALRKENKIGDILLLLEHKPVITLGRNARATNVVASAEFLKQRGVELFECDRGGDVTFHGPGQLVGYPIFDLRGFANSQSLSSRAPENGSKSRSLESRDLVFSSRKHLGVVDFVRRLEDVLIRTCADFAIATKRVPGLTGVWTDPEATIDAGSTNARVGTGALARPVEQSSTAPAEIATNVGQKTNRKGHDFGRTVSVQKEEAASAPGAHDAKIAAIGIHISRSVTSHGFALNVNTDLSYFNLIVPCGITNKPVTSMQKELGRILDLNPVTESISRNFGTIFQSQILWLDTIDTLLGRSVGVPMRPPAEFRKIHKEDESTWA